MLRAAMVVVAALCTSACRDEARDLPVISTVPSFLLQDQYGKSFDNTRLADQVWIADFIFTSCPDTCPLLTRSMRRVQKRLAKYAGLQFVSFTVDPETDSPGVLARYAEEHKADQSNWSFVTGPPDHIRDIIVTGFKQVMDRVPPTDGKPFNVLHGSHFVLVDGKGRIRGFYRTDTEGLEGLVNDAGALTKGGG